MNYFIIILILLPLAKLILTQIRWSLKIDKTKKQLVLQNAITKTRIKTKDIKEWGFRTIYTSSFRTERFLECHLINCKTIIYPIQKGGRKLKINLAELKSILKSNPKEYSKFKGLKRECIQPKYDLWDLYSI